MSRIATLLDSIRLGQMTARGGDCNRVNRCTQCVLGPPRVPQQSPESPRRVYQLACSRRCCGSATSSRSTPRPNLTRKRSRAISAFSTIPQDSASTSLSFPYSETDSYGRVFLVGLLNTLLVAGVGIVLATMLGFLDRHRAAVAQLARGAAGRRLRRTDPQSAAAVSDPVLVSRRAWHAAGAAPKPLAVRAESSSTTAESSCPRRSWTREQACGFAAFAVRRLDASFRRLGEDAGGVRTGQRLSGRCGPLWR